MMSAESSLPQRAARLYGTLAHWIDRSQPVFALALRVYVARVFFLSGLTKLHDWNVTLALFRNEYHVPLLPPAVAAVLGTSAELGLPILLFTGFGTRFAAVALFAFNIVAAISYPDLSAAGLKDHVLWGALLLVLFFYGPGNLSVDRFFEQRFERRIDANDPD
jgi:putative oxidoreductase